MTAEEAMDFVREQGIVLVSAKGPVPRLTEFIAGEPMRGSWWAHRKSRQIFALLQKLGESPDILMCRLVTGHVTCVHRRLWPALVRMADCFERDRLARIRDEHSHSGRHISRSIAYPEWVPDDVLEQARQLTETEAAQLLSAFDPLANLCAARAASSNPAT